MAVSASVRGLEVDDRSLVEMLRRPPKHVPQLRTREAFRDFFRGMPTRRMQALLMQAYTDKAPEEAGEKVAKRMDLLRDVLA